MCVYVHAHIYVYGLEQGSPIPGVQTATDPRPVRNWSAQEEVSSEGARAACSHYCLNRPPYPWKNRLPRNWKVGDHWFRK